MNEEARTFGYLCPECGKPVMASRDPFTLAASDAAIACDCGGAVLRTSYDGERYRITVPCGLCGGTHTAVCTPERTLHGATALTCPKTGQFSCFIGPAGIVEQRMKELARGGRVSGQRHHVRNPVRTERHCGASRRDNVPLR